MKRPKIIHIWAEDPFDGRFLGGVNLPYNGHECARGGYRFDVQAIKDVALKTIKSSRKPKLRLKFLNA